MPHPLAPERVGARVVAWYGESYVAPNYELLQVPARGPDFGPEESPGRGSGLILGRFMPPHLGHQFLVDFARSSVDALTVVLTVGAHDPIPGDLRYAWLLEMFPDVQVLVMKAEDGPQDRQHPRYWDDWKNVIRRLVPQAPQYLFASDPAVAQLATALRATFVPVDPGRQAVPISATLVRANPLANWPFLPLCVRPHFVRRVRLLGPAGSGKSTLAKRLAARFETVLVPEYARGYLGGRSPCANDVQPIARGQWASETALARQANKVLVCDTDLLGWQLWSERLFGASPAWMIERAQQQRYDLTLVLDEAASGGSPDQNDSLARRAFHDACLAAVADEPHQLLGGSWDERFEQACSAVAALLGPLDAASHGLSPELGGHSPT